KIVVDPANDSRIFVGNARAGGGISNDYICCNFQPNTGFVGLLFSDNALSASPQFSRIGGLPGGGAVGVRDIVFEPGSSSNLIVATEDSFGQNFTANSGIWRSTNASTASIAGNVSPTF